MAALSKEERLDEGRRSMMALYVAGVTQMASLVVLLQAGPMIFSKHYNGDRVQTVKTLNRIQSLAALIEFILNPLFGRLSDMYGRKSMLLLAPVATVIMRSVAAKSDGLAPIVLARLINAALVPAFFTSLTAASADLFQDSESELAAVQGKLQIVQGAAMIGSPLLGGYLTARDVKLPYVASAILGGITFAIVAVFFKETLQRDKNDENNKNEGSILSTLMKSNPLSFVRLFTVSTPMTLLNAVLALHTFPMFMGTVPTIFAQEARGWGPQEISRFQSVLGVASIFGGQITGKSIKMLGSKMHAQITNAFSVANYLVWANAYDSWRAYLGIALCTFGQMRRSVVMAKISVLARSSDLGQGELAAYRANLQAVVKFIAPLLFSSLYARGSKMGVHGLAHYGVAGFLGLAQLLLLGVSNDVWKQKSKPQKNE